MVVHYLPAPFVKVYLERIDTLRELIRKIPPSFEDWSSFLQAQHYVYATPIDDDLFHKILQVNQHLIDLREFYKNKCRNDLDWYHQIVRLRLENQVSDLSSYDLDSFAIGWMTELRAMPVRTIRFSDDIERYNEMESDDGEPYAGMEDTEPQSHDLEPNDWREDRGPYDGMFPSNVNRAPFVLPSHLSGFDDNVENLNDDMSDFDKIYAQNPNHVDEFDEDGDDLNDKISDTNDELSVQQPNNANEFMVGPNPSTYDHDDQVHRFRDRTEQVQTLGVSTARALRQSHWLNKKKHNEDDPNLSNILNKASVWVCKTTQTTEGSSHILMHYRRTCYIHGISIVYG